MTIKALYRDEIQNELGELSRLEVGSDTYRTAVEGITKLTDKMNDIEKIEIDAQDKAENRFNDYQLRMKQMEDERKDRNVKNVLTVVSIGTGLGVAIWGTLVSMKFEKTDSFTSLLGRKWVDKTISFIKK